MFVKVAIPRPLEGLFDYALPDEVLNERPDLKVGTLVEVSFGSSIQIGVIMGITNEPPALSGKIKIKPVLKAFSSNFDLDDDLIQIAKFGSEYFQCPLGEAFSGSLPPDPSSVKKPRMQNKQDEMRGSFELSPAQQVVFETWKSEVLLKDPTRVTLLEGVTGSGKTEVYLECAKEVLKLGKSVLILVPEISLTSQTQDRFQKHLGHEVGLWHSALPKAFRQQQWLRMKSGDLKVLVAARSGVFVPIKDLGLVVIDEEHDSSYKQEDRYRYHGRDLAIYRAKIRGASVILGSATPSQESYKRIDEGGALHLELKSRFGLSELPTLHFIDLREIERDEEGELPDLLIHPTVQTAMDEALARNEQVMVFINRRGYSPFLLCTDCGHIPECRHCSMSLTFHKGKRRLQCHICGLEQTISDLCEKCGSHEVHPTGMGTESVEEALAHQYPNQKVLRLDRDQMTSHKRLEETLNAFRRGDAQIMVGTQMLVKGHDFPRVSTVVVMNVDALMKWPDFRSEEKALQTLIQIAGRSGRGEVKGHVYFQTFDPDHRLFKVLKGEDTYQGFQKEESEVRRTLRYPPYSRMVRYRFQGRDPHLVERTTKKIKDKILSEVPSIEPNLLGPSVPVLGKVKDEYRFDLYLKASNLREMIQVSQYVKRLAIDQNISVMVDVDPYSS